MVTLMTNEQLKKSVALELTNAFINLKAMVIFQNQSAFADKDRPYDPADEAIWEEVFVIYNKALTHSESLVRGVVPKT